MLDVWIPSYNQYCKYIELWEVKKKVEMLWSSGMNLHGLIFVLITGGMQDRTNQRSGEDMPGVQLLQSGKG